VAIANGQSQKDATFMSSEAKLGRVIVGRILPGSDLVTGIEKICRKHDVRQAIILGAIGSIVNPHIEWAAFTEARPVTGNTASRTLAGAGSLMSGQGLVCETEGTDELNIHIHCTVTDPSGTVLGGHFNKQAVEVLSTTDLTLVEITGVKVIRRPDPISGKMFTFIEATNQPEGCK
jgi:hypothetical protein